MKFFCWISFVKLNFVLHYNNLIANTLKLKLKSATLAQALLIFFSYFKIVKKSYYSTYLLQKKKKILKL